MKPSSTFLEDDFSFRVREQNLKRIEEETFDILVIGGGITGAGVAWDAASRGYKVALLEKSDFAQGTSSRSSKLAHGGLRYLENHEYALVFEALSERDFLMKTCPHTVQPLAFYMPVYRNDEHPAWLLSAGMWLYDILSLFRTPGLHQRLTPKVVKRYIPFLKQRGLQAVFKYFDARMWDDGIVIDVLRKAHTLGACVIPRAKVIKTQRDSQGKMTQATFEDAFTQKKHSVKFKKLIVCAGVWTDEVGKFLAESSPQKENWSPWLAPSRGLHLVFEGSKIPLPGAVVMQHPKDGRISFVIPRPDFGQGVTIVGTTDGPCSAPPDQIENETQAIQEDTQYLIQLLQEYFPSLKISERDVINHYIGIRPLVDPQRGKTHGSNVNLQKVSREHTIDDGPGESVIVAGGKYTTFRRMAHEIVDFAIGKERHPQTQDLLFPPASLERVQSAKEEAIEKKYNIPEKLFERYGADALKIYEIHLKDCDIHAQDPAGFPCLEAQLRYAVRYQMVLTVDDFIRRRQPLYLCRQDHGQPWYPILEKALKEELERKA